MCQHEDDEDQDDLGDLIYFDHNSPFRCWCGAEGIYRDMCDDACLEEPCDGSGEVNCYCGGDQCVCHHHGSATCPGCENCRPDMDDDWDDDMDDDDEEWEDDDYLE